MKNTADTVNIADSNENSTNKFIKLPDSELKVMQIIWDMYKQNKKDDAGSMMSAYPHILGHLKLTTVLTLISRLNEKGFIRTEKCGRINYYIPLVAEEQYKNNAAVEFVENVYKSSPISLMSALFDVGVIKQEDIDEFRRQILDKNNKNNKNNSNSEE